jgi:hypothetical protein
MPKRSTPRGDHMRQAVAQEAARIMAQQSLTDFFLAKRKAAERLGASEHSLPGNREIEQALLEYQRLFGGAQHEDSLCRLRQAALRAMHQMREFNPHLVGPVLTGAAHKNSEVQLHLFSDTPEQVAMALISQKIPYHAGERQQRYGGDRSGSCPCFTFVAGDVVFELLVFPVDGLREAPLSPVDGRPLHRARTREVQALLVN